MPCLNMSMQEVILEMGKIGDSRHLRDGLDESRKSTCECMILCIQIRVHETSSSSRFCHTFLHCPLLRTIWTWIVSSLHFSKLQRGPPQPARGLHHWHVHMCPSVVITGGRSKWLAQIFAIAVRTLLVVSSGSPEDRGRLPIIQAILMALHRNKRPCAWFSHVEKHPVDSCGPALACFW